MSMARKTRIRDDDDTDGDSQRAAQGSDAAACPPFLL